MTAQTKGAALSVSTIARRILAAIEPWYDWGTIHVERMEGTNAETMNPGGEGPVRFVQLQWFGLHIGFQIGRTPKKWSR
jgi:hypothetical protein